MMFRTNLAKVLHVIAWLAAVAGAIQSWDIAQPELTAICVSIAVALSIAWWWEDRAARRIRAQTEMLERARLSIEHLAGKSADAKSDDHAKM